MGDNLYEWCLEKDNEHPDLELDCSSLASGYDDSDLGDELVAMITTSLKKKLDGGDLEKQLDNDIVVKRKQVSDIKKLLETKNFLTHERRHQELKKISKSYYEKMVIMIILLAVAIIMGIILIYYFFIFRKK